MLARLHKAEWRSSAVVGRLMEEKIAPSFIARWRRWLEAAVEDPDSLWSDAPPEGLVDELVAKNLIVFYMSDGNPMFWIDRPPPEKDPELGIGRRVAWQTPLHREAIRRALEGRG
jgi:hypothetical protein